MGLKKKHSFVQLWFLGSLFFTLPVFAQGESLPDSARCWVELRCGFSGLEVWLDGERVGQTPLPLLSMNAGRHTLRVRHPDPSDWLSRDWKMGVLLEVGERRVLVVQFPKIYWVGSDPPGASVFWDDRRLGKTPTVVELPPGDLGFLILRKAGYEDHRVDLRLSQSSLIHVQLGAMRLRGGDGSPRLRKEWVIGSGVVALLSGVAGYYFKHRADGAYDKYMRSGHPDEMDRHFNDSVSFDKLSGIFYGLGEVSLGVSLFFFMRGVWSR